MVRNQGTLLSAVRGALHHFDLALVLSSGLGLLLVAGCGGIQRIGTEASALASISGTTFGGQQPLSNSLIQMYAVGNAGDGSAATPLLSTPVHTNSTGGFSITESYACPPEAAQIYFVATGGGLSVGPMRMSNNSAVMISLAGTCANLESNIAINEVTTVAAISALAPFMTSYSQIGSGTADIGSFNAAVTKANELANFLTGSSPGPALTQGQVAPVQKLNTLADVLVTCMNSAGGVAGDGSACGNLFSDTRSNLGIAPTDTGSAMLNIALNPTQNVLPIFLLSPSNGAFNPALTAAPADWTLPITSAVSTPVMVPAPGTYSGPQTVAISDSDPFAQIYYTTDGTAPTSSSRLYTGAIQVSASTTIRAIALLSGLSSAALAGAYTINLPVSVSLTPASVSLSGSQTQQFGAMVTGSSNTAVTWSVSPAVGSISAAGLYTAPAMIATVQTVTVTATSVADTTKHATASISLVPTVSVSVNPANVTLSGTQAQQLSATVTGSSNTAVTWSVSPAVGSISAAGLYTAPAMIATVQTVTVTAASAADTTKHATASISLVPTVSVSLTPASVSLSGSQTQQFGAMVTGSSNTAVTWSVSPAVGSISAAGLYTAPATIAAAQTVTVTATSVADTTKYATATVSLLPPVSVSVNPANVSLSGSQTQQFAATVTGSSNTAVVWSISPAMGSISAAGLYTAPAMIAAVQTVTVTATSAADTTKHATASISLVPTVSVSATPASVSLSGSQAQQFGATVTGSSNTAVTWSISPAVGSISAAGLYTAPATIAAAQTVTVTATSVADTTRHASASISLVPTVSVSLTPGSVSLSVSQTQQFGATVTGSSNTAVVWSISPAMGGISAAGLYTAPAMIAAAQTVTVTATSVADTTKSATATISLALPVIPASYFGLTVLNFTQLTPSMSFGTTRSWDAGPNLDWSDANPAAGVYNFTYLDRFIAINQARGADIIYTFGRTPQWASSQPNNTTSAYGPGECAPPSSMTYWDNYVTAIATHAAGRIKYWELWNEPNESTYCGDMPTMVTMAQHAARIIKAIDPTALILTPSPDKASGPAWLSAFLAQGGAGSVDVIAFHGYWDSTAEAIVSVVAGYRTVMAANGVANLPMWDTESSWAYTSNMRLPPSASQVGFIAKYYLLHWSQGVARFAWYAYDGQSPWGSLWTPGAGETPAAFAYGEIYKWMVGATLTAPCSEAVTGIWKCPLSRSNGYSAEAVWISNSSVTFSVPAQYTQYLDLAGVVHQVSNGTVTVGDQPILLETGPLP